MSLFEIICQAWQKTWKEQNWWIATTPPKPPSIFQVIHRSHNFPRRSNSSLKAHIKKVRPHTTQILWVESILK